MSKERRPSAGVGSYFAAQHNCNEILAIFSSLFQTERLERGIDMFEMNVERAKAIDLRR
jgi:hypothetical protein